MSRRHHGGRPHRPGGHPRPPEASRGPGFAPPDRTGFIEPGTSLRDAVTERPARTAESAPPPIPRERQDPSGADRAAGEPTNGAAQGTRPNGAPRNGAPGYGAPGNGEAPGGSLPVPNGTPPANRALTNGTGANGSAANGSADGDSAATCTAPQLRRFIKSRPYVPMHELRRRFGINGGEDDVTAVDLGAGRVFVGLPQREGALLGELLRGGEIGYELSMDPRSPVVVGLYPMRPVART